MTKRGQGKNIGPKTSGIKKIGPRSINMPGEYSVISIPLAAKE